MVRLGLVVALLALWGAVAHAYDRALPMGLYAAGNGPALAMLDSQIEVTVRGPVVETVVTQRFHNATDRATEATYIFPLPADAAVSAMAIRVGARTIQAAIEPREAAQRRYEAAVTGGTAAALLDQERPDVFTQTVSAIPAKATVELTLRYDTLARYEAGTWQLALPMVVAPRYVPGTASGRATTGSGRAPDTERAPDASRITPAAAPGAGGSTAVVIHFADEPSEVTSPTHALVGTRRDAAFSDPHSDHDAIVRWKAPVAAAGWLERDGDAGFAAVVVEAPPPPATRAPVRVILAIDRAATTRGDGDAVEHPLVGALLRSLGHADRVRVIGGATVGWSAPDDARAAVERAWAAPAGAFDLTRVLAAARPEGAAIVLISDGLVADDPAAIAAARRLGVAVHVIGIGPAPARATLTQLAATSGGTVRFAIAGDDLGALAHAALADVARAPAPLAVNWGTLAASDVEPAVLPRLGAGQAMIVLARIKHAQAANARVRGELFAFEALGPARTPDGAVTARGPLARRWARERLGDLLAARHDRETVTRHALAYGLVSPYTSFVAVGTDVVVQGGVRHSVAVPVSLPSGMRWHVVKQAIDRDTGVDTGGDTGGDTDGDTNGDLRGRDASTEARRGAPDAPPRGVPSTPAHGAGAPVRTPAPTKVAGKSAPGAAAPPPPPAPPPGKHRVPSRKSDDSAGDVDHDGVADSDDADVSRSTRVKHKKPAREQDADEDDKPAKKPAPARPKQAEKPAEQSPRADQARSVAEDDAERGGGREDDAKEVVEVTGSLLDRELAVSRSESISLAPSRRARLTAALGGGLVFDHGGHGLLALDVRLETAGRTKLGGEASLWLVGATDPEGRALLTVGRALSRWLELGFGAGIQLGNGTGVAGSLRLRVATPLPTLAGFLRYDSAALLTRPRIEAEQAITLGAELSY